MSPNVSFFLFPRRTLWWPLASLQSYNNRRVNHFLKIPWIKAPPQMDTDHYIVSPKFSESTIRATKSNGLHPLWVRTFLAEDIF